MLTRRRFAGLAGLSLAAPALISRGALAQGFPSKPVRIVVPFAPAGATDIIARTLADRFAQAWGQQVTVENKPGAGGNIGVDTVAKADADGHTILIVSVGMAVNRYLYTKLAYDPVADFAPVSLLCMVPNIMVVPAASPSKLVADFVARAKAEAGKLTYASSGIGTSLHLSGELFKRMAGIDMTHVPYRGSGPALTDLVAGRVDVMFDNITAALPQVQGGALRALAVTTAKRVKAVPDLPPIADTLPGFDVSSWFSFFVPGKTPPDAIAKLHADTVAALGVPAVRQRLEGLGAEPVGSTPDGLRQHLASEMDKWGRLIRDAGIKVDG